MPRQIAAAAREAIIRAFEEDGDYCQVAESLHVNKKTAHRIVSTFQRSGQREALQRGACRPKMMTEEMISALVSFVEDKPTLTLNEMRGKLVECFPDEVVPSTMTISRALDGALITLKLLRSPTTQWNSGDVKRRSTQNGSFKTGSFKTWLKLTSFSWTSAGSTFGQLALMGDLLKVSEQCESFADNEAEI